MLEPGGGAAFVKRPRLTVRRKANLACLAHGDELVAIMDHILKVHQLDPLCQAPCACVFGNCHRAQPADCQARASCDRAAEKPLPCAAVADPGPDRPSGIALGQGASVAAHEKLPAAKCRK